MIELRTVTTTVVDATTEIEVEAAITECVKHLANEEDTVFFASRLVTAVWEGLEQLDDLGLELLYEVRAEFVELCKAIEADEAEALR